ncbi:MAG: YqiJ family protein [Fimbriimonadales bacterium]|nr:YqiJ family protein [Fimbriimonadales bacterium]
MVRRIFPTPCSIIEWETGMSLATLLEWWNFIFALPLAVGGLLLLGLALSGMIDLDGDHASGGESHADQGDAHAEHADALHDADADLADADGDDHAPAKVPHSHDHHADAEKPLWLQILNLFGIGMGLPLSMALPLLMMIWGAVGLISNGIFEPLLKVPAFYAPLSGIVAMVSMALIGRTAGLTIRRILREEAPPIVNKYGLIGATGRAVYEITDEGGVAHVRDRYGNLHRIVCRAAPGEPNIPAETPILVARYDEHTHLYWVERNPLELPEEHTGVQSPTQLTQHIGGHTHNGG